MPDNALLDIISRLGFPVGSPGQSAPSSNSLYAAAQDAPSDDWQGTGFRRLSPPPSEGAPQSGMRGTQSGPADESNTMAMERTVQRALSTPAAMGLGVLGLAATGGNALAMAPGVGVGLGMSVNSENPDIREVWADRIRQWLQSTAKNPY